MIAGTAELGGSRVRVLFAPDALARVAAAATLGIDGPHGLAETRRFLHAVIHPADQARYARAAAADPVAAAATAIAVILAHAAASPDPDVRDWAAAFRTAIVRFQAGHQRAFADLAIANAAGTASAVVHRRTWRHVT